MTLIYCKMAWQDGLISHAFNMTFGDIGHWLATNVPVGSSWLWGKSIHLSSYCIATAAWSSVIT